MESKYDKYGLNQNVNVVIYARVSTDDDSQVNSFEVQKSYYQKFCKDMKWNYMHTYSDQGKSGTNAGRNGFIQMLKDAGIDTKKVDGTKHYNYFPTKRKPKFNLIIVKDVARFARDIAIVETLTTLLKEKGVYVLFESQDICTAQENFETTLSMFAMLAQAESRANSKRQRFAMMYRKKNKIFTGNALAYGYERNDKNEIVVNEEKAKIVELIFERIQHVGTRMVARELNEQGYKTETGIAWSASQIHQIVDKKAYYGNPEINKYNTLQLNSVAKKLPSDDYVETENKLPAIISKETYDKAREKIKERTSISGHGQRQPKTDDIFYHKVKCGCCGGMYTRKRTLRKNKDGTTKEYYSYYCLNKNKKSNCNNKRTVADNILKRLVCTETPVIEVKVGFGDTYSRIEHSIEKMKQRHASVIDSLQQELEEIENKIAAGSEKMLLDLDVKTIETLDKLISKLTVQKDEITGKINRLTFSNLDDLLYRANERKKEIQKNSKSSFTDDEKIELVKEIYVNADNTFDYSYYTPDYNDIIDELNDLLADDLKISASQMVETKVNSYKYLYENKNFVNVDTIDYYDSIEEYEEIQYQMSEIEREKHELN